MGFAEFEVYRREKRDHKKTAARILLVEIENAERQLAIIKESDKLSENVRLMSSASWEKYRHLFGQDFTAREWDTISDFYNRCTQYDKAVDYDSSNIYHDIEAYRTSVNNALALSAANIIVGNPALSDEEIIKEYAIFKDKLDKAYMSNFLPYSPTKPINDAAKALQGLDSTLSLTSVGNKLRKLPSRRFGSAFLIVDSSNWHLFTLPSYVHKIIKCPLYGQVLSRSNTTRCSICGVRGKKL